MRDTDLREAADLIDRAGRIVIFTGAGVSAESGIPTFRDALSGLWEQFDPRRLATPEAFGDDPALVWGWYEWRRAAVQQVEPNAGHRALAVIEQRAPECVVVTQNVDDLHERAGSKEPIHLHGSLFAPRCSACGRPATVANGAPAVEGRVPPPPCDHCGAPIRPGVVWFGEALPADAFEAAVAAAANCDLLITVGTSAVVFPAAEIPQVTARMGGAMIQVNPEPTPLDAVARVNLHGPAAEVLPALAAV
ncbi:SIR2 family NAD-dependent protein deacylase [Actinoplanes sp. NPDC051343]|uniref:SIR2 family NAD-dependent protein deacylase n=1 Tax=Actinoplanes sp. NPDC051343 TaxID=3363906 RepID=UPI0037AE6404